jgi:hypothetical protein
MSRMRFRGAGPVGPSPGVHHWAALPFGVKVSDDEVNTAERGPSHANHQNENVPGTHTRPFRSQIGRTSVPGMVGGASSNRNQSSDECGRLILGYCTRGLSVIAPPVATPQPEKDLILRTVHGDSLRALWAGRYGRADRVMAKIPRWHRIPLRP